MIKKPYNIFDLDISNGLDALPVGTAGGYISLLEAPTNANVKIHLNERDADPIPLKAYHAIEATEIEQIFVSADAVANEKITLVQAKRSQDFKMITPASDVNVDSINELISYNPTALEQMDKIINPYQFAILTNGDTNSPANTTLLSKTLAADKIKISLSLSRQSYPGHQSMWAKLDGIYILQQFSYFINANAHGSFAEIEIEDCKGKLLEIVGASPYSTLYVSYALQEFTLK